MTTTKPHRLLHRLAPALAGAVLAIATVTDSLAEAALPSATLAPQSTTAAATFSTSSTTSTSSTITENPDDHCRTSYRLYDPVEIHSLVLSGYWISPGSCGSPVKGAVLREHALGMEVEFPPGFHGPATILECGGEVHHSLCAPTMDDLGATISLAYSPDGSLLDTPAVCSEELLCRYSYCGDRGPTEADLCGDVSGDHQIRTSDALLLLRSAVSGKACPLQRCDINRDGSITASDALRVLGKSVGLAPEMLCPAPCTPASAPV